MSLTFQFIAARVRCAVHSERGALLVEYGLLLSLIVAVCIAAVGLLGNKAKSGFTSISNSI